MRRLFQRASDPPDAVAPVVVPVLGRRPRIGLALGSGVARGWAHIGVLRALDRMGIAPDVIVGTSVGALVGGCYLAGKLDTLEDWARSLTRLRVLSYFDLSMVSGGMIAGSRLDRLMRQHLGNVVVSALDRPFIAIAADLQTGHEVWLRDGPLVDVIRASFAMPGVFPPLRLNDRWLIDGAIVNPIPISACRALGAELVIAVNLNADLIGKARKPGPGLGAASGLEEIELRATGEARLNGWTRRLFRREPGAPSMFGAMVASVGIVQDRISRARLAGDPPDVHVVPRLGHIGLGEFHRAAELVAEGEAAIERHRGEIQDALAVFGSVVATQGSMALQETA